jgi:hypothetical protein
MTITVGRGAVLVIRPHVLGDPAPHNLSKDPSA